MAELVELRTRTSKTHDLGVRPDGRKRFAIDAVIGALHYRENPADERAAWLDIDTRISNGEVRAAPYIGWVIPGKVAFRMESRWGGWHTVELAVPEAPMPRYDGNKAIWEDVFEDCDVVVEFGSCGMTMYRILKSERAPREFNILIDQSSRPHAVLRDVQEAEDATGQRLRMVSSPIAGGRRERVLLEHPEGLALKPLAYPIVDATTIDDQVDSDDDDAWEDKESTVVNDTGNEILYRSLNSDNTIAWARFEGVAIPQSATIDTCYTEIYISQIVNDMDFDFFFEDAAGPIATDGSNGDISGRAKTTAFVR